MRDGDAALARRGDVDAVVADAEHRDDLERRQLGDQLARHLRLAARRDRADSRRGRGEGGRVALVDAVVHAERAAQRLPSSAARAWRPSAPRAARWSWAKGCGVIRAVSGYQCRDRKRSPRSRGGGWPAAKKRSSRLVRSWVMRRRRHAYGAARRRRRRGHRRASRTGRSQPRSGWRARTSASARAASGSRSALVAAGELDPGRVGAAGREGDPAGDHRQQAHRRPAPRRGNRSRGRRPGASCAARGRAGACTGGVLAAHPALVEVEARGRRRGGTRLRRADLAGEQRRRRCGRGRALRRAAARSDEL